MQEVLVNVIKATIVQHPENGYSVHADSQGQVHSARAGLAHMFMVSFVLLKLSWQAKYIARWSQLILINRTN